MYIRPIGIASLILGILFKFLHWPGASVLLLAGAVLTVVTMTILLVKRPGPWSLRIERPGVIVPSVAMALAGVVLKLMHWPGANFLMLLGMVACAGWVLLSPPQGPSRIEHA